MLKSPKYDNERIRKTARLQLVLVAHTITPPMQSFWWAQMETYSLQKSINREYNRLRSQLIHNQNRLRRVVKMLPSAFPYTTLARAQEIWVDDGRLWWHDGCH